MIESNGSAARATVGAEDSQGGRNDPQNEIRRVPPVLTKERR